MATGLGGSTSGGGGGEAGSFECNICFELAQDPIVTLCGHLFCWPCLYKWLHGHARSSECPVCKALVEEDKLVPLYGRGKNTDDPRSRPNPGANIPQRPTGQRPATAPPPDPHQFGGHPNSWFMGGGGGGAPPMAATRLGNFAFSAAFGGLFPLLSFHMHGFADPGAYGAAAAGIPYGYGYSNAFHGGHWHGQGHGNRQRQAAPQGQQQDSILKWLMIAVGLLVIYSLVFF